jgi:Fe-S cluster assembly protein SufD
MSQAAEQGYLEQLLRGQASLPASPRVWLNGLRADALERANALAVPSTRDEDWRFTDLSPLYRTVLPPAARRDAVEPGLLVDFALTEAGPRLVFVDGHYVPALSDPLIDAGVTVSGLAEALEQGQDGAVPEHLGRYADFHADAFAAVNTAWLHDAAVITLARDRVLARPVHVLFVSTQPGVSSTPRVLMVAQTGSGCTLVEDYVALHEDAYLTNAVSEIALGPSARLRHVRLQRESKAAYHIAACAVRLQRDAQFESVSVTLGGRISRYSLNVTHAGEGGECRIDGLALIDGRQLADTHSTLDHTRPDGRSRQLHKCIVGGAAHAVFNGKIFVREGAQRTDSSQQSRNLLLTDKAHVDTKPQLEIFADDVKCAHGATVGQLDADQVFYLKSRGLSEGAARDLLTFAFAAEVVERIPVPSLARRLEQTVVHQTKGKQT